MNSSSPSREQDAKSLRWRLAEICGKFRAGWSGGGASTMGLNAFTKSNRRTFVAYRQFEGIALACVMVLIGVIIVCTTVFVAIKLVGDLTLGEALLDKAALQDTFGLILLIVILIEFNRSIFVAMTHRTGAIQTRIFVLITVLVIVRKLMLQDIAALDFQALLGFGGLLLALGGLYWFISDSDRRRARWDLNELPKTESPKRP
jgi:uncharacterized membrane protein (DUF373 family)